MKTISTQKDLKKSLKEGEKEFTVTNKRLLKALAVAYWIQNNKVKGALLLAALPVAFSAAPLVGIVGAGLVIGGFTITAVEILAIGAVIIVVIAIIKGQEIKEIDTKLGKVEFK